MISVMPSNNPLELIEANPLGTVPTLVMDNGKSLCESPVICEYLDSLSIKNPLFPIEKTERFEVLALAALADGIMDAAVACVMEGRRPEEKHYPEWVERKENSIKRTIAVASKLDHDVNNWNIGIINIAIALAYVSFRLPHIEWQNNHKNLSNWFNFINKKPSMLATAPSA